MQQVSVTFRHMDASDALKEYANRKVEHITKYFPDPIKAHVVLACERGFNHCADVTLTLRNGLVIKGYEATEDMYSSLDLAMAKIERQIRRYKDRIKDHRPATAAPVLEVEHSVVEMATAPEAMPETEKPKVLRTQKFYANPLTVDQAVMQLNLLGDTFLVFTNAETHQVNVIYRRQDETYGLIETGAAVTAR